MADEVVARAVLVAVVAVVALVVATATPSAARLLALRTSAVLRRTRARAVAMRDAGARRSARGAASALLGGVSAVLAVAAPARATAAPEAVAADHPRSARPASERPAAASPRPVEVVVVRRGDTLWGIARRHLAPHATDAQIARAWPRWYTANRAVIGPDPGLIRPGQRLRAPDARPTGTSSSQHHRSPSVDDAAASFDPDRR